MHEGDNRREVLQLTYPLSSGKSDQKKDLLCEGTQRNLSKRFEAGGVKKPQNQGEVPCRRTKLAGSGLQSKRAKEIAKHRMRRERRKLKAKNRRQHRTVTLDGRDPEVLRRVEPAKKIRRFSQRWIGVRMAMRVAPLVINLPLQLISLAR